MMGKGGDDGLRTVECLRGRLLAERVASKAAKEQADNMTKRLEELERKLAEEIECRNRAERRLEHALKKLESLKILEGRGAVDSPTVDSGEVAKEAPSLQGSEDLLGDDLSGRSSADSPHHEEGSWSSDGTAAPSHNKGEPHGDESNKGGSPQVSIAVSARQSSFSDNNLNVVEDQDEEVVNSLALVPEILQPNLASCRPEANNNVQRVLIALRNVKVHLQYSTGRRTGVWSPGGLHGW